MTAHDLKFAWAEPAQREDGAPLDPGSEIKAYRLRCEGPESVTTIVAREEAIPVFDTDVLFLRDELTAFDGAETVVDTGFDVAALAGKSFVIETIVEYGGEAERTWTPLFGADASVNRFFVGKRAGTTELSVWIGGLGSYSVDVPQLFDGQERYLAVVYFAAAQTLAVVVDDEAVLTERGVAGPLDASGSLLIGGVGHDAAQRWLGSVHGLQVSVPTAYRLEYHWQDAVQKPGTYQCSMTAVDSGGRESVWGFAEKPYVVADAPLTPPAPPTEIVIAPGESVIVRWVRAIRQFLETLSRVFR